MFKKILGLIILLFIFVTGSVFAFANTVKISKLPEYIKHDNFKLSYSALSESSVPVQFFFRKEGENYVPFGPVFYEASGQIQVGGVQIDEQVKYYFKVEINGGTTSDEIDETSVIYDHSGPSPVQSYWKEVIGGSHNRLHWKTPVDSDFSRVFIYRSDSLDFTADPSTKRGELGGAPDQEMTWDDVGLDSSITYYYALRAIDKAGNSSSVVADPEVTATVITEEVVTESEAGEEVILLPSGEGEGRVLGEEEDIEEIVVDEPETAFGEAVDTLTGTTKGRIAAISAFVVGLILYFITKRRKY
jgi:hypothetical protein